MRTMLCLLTAVTFGLITTAYAENTAEGPCKEIKDACLKAGFVQGEAKEGKGLWKDCIDPLMQGTTAKKSVLPLPKVDATVITNCKQKHPKFGSGKVAN